ncbi:hypothetical protein FisN_15Hh224 [Fistulifera solaris]|uniref:Uncharacterized protein n=1 Tax=Fistulifera solaris TaxID=1519565 RepID=A0A1Z5JFG5_FISSO|nr:hypothetical protein FisN_15Hh224 [Fistulifera solaris]|eukprot:GAX12745.1 hypothetical protein FisN_15Hh224 [Fistulifera solaris]
MKYTIIFAAFCSLSLALEPSSPLSRRRTFSITAASIAAISRPSVAVEPYPFEARDRKSNQGAIIREDYWYLVGKVPPRQLSGPLKADDPQWNAFGSCTSNAVTGNSCTYVSLKQRAPAYSKYSFALSYGAKEYAKLGQLLQQRIALSPTDETLWDEAREYLVTPMKSIPPAIIDAELKGVLFATAMTTSPNFPGPTRELLVARFYMNEAHYASQQMLAAVEKRDIVRAIQAWEFGKDSWNSYFQIVNRSIVPKVGEKFEQIV